MLLGIKSTAIKFGDNTKYWLSGFATTMLTSLAYTGYNLELEIPYYIALGYVGTHLFHQIVTLNPNKPEDCAKKFVSNKFVGLVLFFGMAAGNFLKNRVQKKENS